MTESVSERRFSAAGTATSGDAADFDAAEVEVDAVEVDEVEMDDFEVDEIEALGVDPAELADEDLIREMQSLHRTRLDTLRHAADTALANHLRRTAELETEYLTRHPGREIDPSRLRDGE